MRVISMKAGRKRVATRAKTRMRRRQRRKTLVICLAVISLVIGVSVYFVQTFLSSISESQYELIDPSIQFKPENPNPEREAAIVDQLSFTYPNPAFIESAASILTRSGYTVDYFRGEKVTVDFYRYLPSYGYSLIIFRVHSSALAALEGKEFMEAPVTFFTSEDYSQVKYRQEQVNGQLLKGSYSMPNPPYYFGITPKFVTASMKGEFQNTTVVMMGCEGLKNTKMAEAFIEKEAKVYVGWTRSISASYTDQATACLMQHLVAEKQSIEQAINSTIEDVGPDQMYSSQLTYYPQ